MEFARYLFSQGYCQNQITILVTYQEQLIELQKVITNILKQKYIFMNYIYH